MKACTYCGRENDAVATHCVECGTPWPTPEVRQPMSKQTKRFAILCVAAPGAIALAYPSFAFSVPVSATLTIVGLLLSCVLLIWSLLSLVRHWQRALLGLLSLLVAFCFLTVMADIFAVHIHRTKSPPEKLDAQMSTNPRLGFFPFLTSLLRFRSGWRANHALLRTWPSR